MTVIANIFESSDDESPRSCGNFEFIAIPSPGDIIPLLGPGGMSWEYFRVLYVEHSPVEIPRPVDCEDQQPWASVYVKFERREAT